MNEENKLILTKDCSQVSETILRVNYDETEREITIQFKTATWRYIGVPMGVWNELIAAESVDDFITTRIKPDYQAIKIQ